MTAASATVAVAITVLAIVLVGHGRPLKTTPSKPPTAPASRGVSIPIGPGVGAPRQAAQQAGPGAPILSTVRIVAQTRDPRGGLPWGIREFQTTRGQTCLQAGRVENAMIGVIGQDGAWSDDHLFHPIFADAFTADFCAQTDGDGDGFVNVTQASETASGGAQPAELQSQGCGISGAHGDRCRRADLRVLQYGLLGPDAVSIAYLGAGGGSLTEPTTGPGGAYLIVGLATKRLCGRMWSRSGCGHEAPGGYSYGPTLESGLVTKVRYRDGHICPVPPPPPPGAPLGTHQASCPVVGYVAPPARHLTAALVAAPVSARKVTAKPVVGITFTARVAVSNENSYYQYTLPFVSKGTPNCSQVTGGSTFGMHIRAGQRVVLADPLIAHCTGVLQGTVAYVPNTGPAGAGYPGPGGPALGGARSIIVGRFRLAIR